MTYSRNEIVGRSLADAVSALCSAATGADRWARFRGCIELSDKQTVSIGGDYMQGPGLRILGGPEPAKTRDEIDADAYAAALRPMVDDLAAGELVAECWGEAASLAATPLPAHVWRSAWKLIVEGQSATLRLLDGSGNTRGEYELLPLQLAQVEPPRAAADSALPAKATPADEQKGKPGRKKIDDAEPMKRLLELLLSGNFKSVRKAVEHMVDVECLEIEGNSFDAKYERLRRKLEKTHIVEEAPGGVTLKPRVPENAT